jgi:DNA-binding NarL/FixJ family response regulator
VRVVIADDNSLVREGVAAFLRRADIDVAGQAASPEELLREVADHRPDVAIIDIRMPPSFTDEGLRAAHEIRARHPDMGIVILSQDVEAGTAARLLAESPAGLGYLLKDRVGDAEEFASTLRRVAAGGSALDPQVVARWLASARDDGPLATLSPREREVLGLLAEGRSNRAIGERLQLSQRAVQKHVTAVFAKLGLESDEDDNRRVLAVLAYLRGAA